MYGNEDEHLEVRKKIVSHMRANAEWYRSYIDGDIHDHFDRQKNANGTTDSWATEAEVSAAATMYSHGQLFLTFHTSPYLDSHLSPCSGHIITW